MTQEEIDTQRNEIARILTSGEGDQNTIDKWQQLAMDVPDQSNPESYYGQGNRGTENYRPDFGETYEQFQTQPEIESPPTSDYSTEYGNYNRIDPSTGEMKGQLDPASEAGGKDQIQVAPQVSPQIDEGIMQTAPDEPLEPQMGPSEEKEDLTPSGTYSPSGETQQASLDNSSTMDWGAGTGVSRRDARRGL